MGPRLRAHNLLGTNVLLHGQIQCKCGLSACPAGIYSHGEGSFGCSLQTIASTACQGEQNNCAGCEHGQPQARPEGFHAIENKTKQTGKRYQRAVEQHAGRFEKDRSRCRCLAVVIVMVTVAVSWLSDDGLKLQELAAGKPLQVNVTAPTPLLESTMKSMELNCH